MKVLCAVDGSEFSLWGVEALRSLIVQRPDPVILLHVADTRSLKARGRKDRETVKASLAAVIHEGEQLLHHVDQVACLALSHAPTRSRSKVRTVMVQGAVPETVVRQANRRRVDLLILGSRGLSDDRTFPLGSVARSVVSLSSRPVLVVKRPLGELTRVVLAIDGSKHARVAADFLRRAVLPMPAHLSIISVVPPVVTDLAARVLPRAQLDALAKPEAERARQLLGDMRETFLKEGCAVMTEVVSGPPSQAILAYADKHHADLVVVGSRGSAKKHRFPLGSVSERVIKYAPCAVLVVRSARA